MGEPCKLSGWLVQRYPYRLPRVISVVVNRVPALRQMTLVSPHVADFAAGRVWKASQLLEINECDWMRTD